MQTPPQYRQASVSGEVLSLTPRVQPICLCVHPASYSLFKSNRSMPSRVSTAWNRSEPEAFGDSKLHITHILT
jgi:hypothetical protein